MAENLSREDQLLKYLDGEMTPIEKSAFEAQLKKDATLQEDLECLQLSRSAIQYYGIHEDVSAVRKEFEQKAKKKDGKLVTMRRFVRPALTAAACIILLAAGIVGYRLYQLSPEKVFNESFVDYSVSESRGGVTSQTAIEMAYQQKEFRKVVALASAGTTSQDKLLVGLSYLQLNNFAAAIGQFSPIIKNGGSTYKQDAEFYLALSYLRNKQYDEALKIVDQIKSDPAHLYHNQVSGKISRELKWLKWKE
jgi:predicted negative regulator of RcsB-dependent stress response